MQGITEPHRRSLLDVLRHNFKFANRETYVHRLIYIGKHTFMNDPGEGIAERFRNIITEVNSKYYVERLTGFLLYYPTYFCHVVEGSEDTLQKHARRIINDNRFGGLKILCTYHHINQRFLTDWTSLTARPPTLLERIDPNSNLENTSIKILYCLQKLYKLGNVLKKQEENLLKESKSDSLTIEFVNGAIVLPMPSAIAERRISKAVVFENTQSSIISKADPLTTVTPLCLPEYTLLEFLIESPYTQDVRKYCSSFGLIPNLEKYEDLVWPIAADGVPVNVFDKEIDPVNNLPTFNEQPPESESSVVIA